LGKADGIRGKGRGQMSNEVEERREVEKRAALLTP
jgi:hypothetical protein